MVLLWFLMLLAPSAGCLALMSISRRPNLMTGMCGATMGLVVSICIIAGMSS